MKNITPALRAHLRAGGPFIMADLYTITLVSGQILRWTDFDVDITHPTNSQLYTSSGPVLERGRTRIVIGVEVDTLDISIFPRATDMLNGISLTSATRAGALDRAKLLLERVFLSPSGSGFLAIGTVIQFSGRFADIQLGRTEIQVRVNSGTESLNTEIPIDVYQAGCPNIHYDGAGCTLDRETFRVDGVVSSGASVSSIPCSISRVNGWFNRGYIEFTSGALQGTRRTVKAYTVGLFGLYLPLPAAPAAGDTFKAYPGCDRLQSTCSSKFSNLPNFRGCPYIPVPETAY